MHQNYTQYCGFKVALPKQYVTGKTVDIPEYQYFFVYDHVLYKKNIGIVATCISWCLGFYQISIEIVLYWILKKTGRFYHEQKCKYLAT